MEDSHLMEKKTPFRTLTNPTTYEGTHKRDKWRVSNHSAAAAGDVTGPQGSETIR